MPELLDRIDAAINGVCPCGAELRPGSAYCSYDCEPNYRSRDTTSDGDGTTMRWRPDLITAVDDSDLINLGTNTFYNGPHHAQLFERDTHTWHLRLDDGHRFVGADLNDVPDMVDADFEQRVADKWAALERELGNSRHLEPGPDGDPWVDAWGGSTGRFRAGDAVVTRRVNGPVRAGAMVYIAHLNADPFDSTQWTALGHLTDDGFTHETSWDDPNSNPLADIYSFMQRSVTASFPMSPEAIRSMRESLDRAGGSLRRAFSGVVAPGPPDPEHLMSAVIEARRNRNTGPSQRPRAPRQINPRRGR